MRKCIYSIFIISGLFLSGTAAAAAPGSTENIILASAAGLAYIAANTRSGEFASSARAITSYIPLFNIAQVLTERAQLLGFLQAHLPPSLQVCADFVKKGIEILSAGLATVMLEGGRMHLVGERGRLEARVSKIEKDQRDLTLRVENLAAGGFLGMGTSFVGSSSKR